MSKITLFDKTFKTYIPHDVFMKDIDRVGENLNRDFEGTGIVPVVLCVLNGSVMFTGEIMQRINFPCELGCIRVKSYAGTETTGEVKVLNPLTCDVSGRTVIICEDIVDTGYTIEFLRRHLFEKGAADVKVCTMFFKPEAYKFHGQIPVDYYAREIQNQFIVGFGLDYDELGRNSRDIYILDKPETNTQKMKYYILFGPPGAGKGTQATSMVEKYNLHHISTGNLLRKEIAAGSELGLKAKALIEKGCLVPDEVVEGMIESEFKTVKGVDGFLLDGFPRTIAQAEALDKMLAKTGEEVTAVVSIMIPDEMIVERISHRAAIEGRADDASIDTIKNRIATYHNQTEPEIDYYRKAGKYFEADGVGTIDEVRDRIFSIVDKF